MYKRRLLGVALAQASTLKGGRAWRAKFFDFDHLPPRLTIQATRTTTTTTIKIGIHIPP